MHPWSGSRTRTSGIHPVRADAADLAGGVKDALGPSILEQALGIRPLRQVVVGSSGNEDVVTIGLEALDEVRAEKAAGRL